MGNLRQQAEKKLKKMPSETNLPDTLKLIHELQVHQIELEMQNEELMLARSAAQTAVEELIKYREHLEELVHKRTKELEDRNIELEAVIANVKTLKTLLPICSSCKKIRDDKGYWDQVEVYIANHTDAHFSHSLCPECVRKLYPDMGDKVLDAIAKEDKVKKNSN